MKVNIRSMAKGFVVLAVISFVRVSPAADYYLKPDAVDWSKGESYTGGEAPTGGDDLIRLPENTAMALDSANESFARSLETVNKVKGICIPDDSSLTVNVDKDMEDYTISPQIGRTMRGAGYMADGTGWFVKSGPGVLRLSATHQYGIYLNLRVVGSGKLYLPASASGYPAKFYRDIDVRDVGSTLVLSPSVTMYLQGTLSGKGTVQQETEGADYAQIVFYGIPTAPFEGRFTGPYVELYTYPGCVSWLTGADTDINRYNFSCAGTAYLGKIGSYGEASSVGKKSIRFGGTTSAARYGGSVVYVGDGNEKVDRPFYFWYSDTPNVVDAGALPAGELTFTNYWQFSEDKGVTPPGLGRIVLTGSNQTHAAVLQAKIPDWICDGVNYTFRFTKKGTGTWRIEESLPPNASQHFHSGVWAVEDGTLAYTTLREKGQFCALGLSTNLHADVTGVPSSANEVPYAFLLGGENAGSNTVGTFAYSGNSNIVCTTRPMQVTGGGGRILAGDASYFRFAGISAADGGPKLILDGPVTTAHREVSDLSDGSGVLSVVKRGSGKWTVSGDLSFSGTLEVEEGELDVLSLSENEPYTWFRWTVKENGFSCARYPELTTEDAYDVCCVQSLELALYDIDGNRQNVCAVSSPNFVPYHVGCWLEPGQFCYGRGDVSSGAGNDLYCLFDDSDTALSAWGWHAKLPTPPVLDRESTWLPIVMRLTNGVPEITSFDLCTYQGRSKNGKGVTAFSLEGSCDGYNWTTITNMNDVALPEIAFRWYSYPDQAFRAGTRRPLSYGVGYPIDCRRHASSNAALSNCAGVRVARGAVLRRSGTGDIALQGMTVDSAGAGKIDGFSFAENGVIDFRGVSQVKGNVTLPADLSGVSGLPNVQNWTVCVDGVEKPSYRAVATADGVKMIRPGFSIIVR